MYKDIIKQFILEKNEKYISEQEIELLVSDKIQEILNKNQDLDKDVLEKNLKRAFANGLTVLGLMHGAHYMNSDFDGPSERQQSPTYKRIEQKIQNKNSRQPAFNQSTNEIEQARQDAYNEGLGLLDKNKQDTRNKSIKNFLKTISMNESSGGKNLNHAKIKSGIHSGDAAVGQYGLMPNTIKEMVNRMGKDHPLSYYSKMDNKKLAQNLKKNPKHEEEIGNFMANHLYDKFGGDENKMAYSWFQGHNLENDHFQNDHKDYLNHDYVVKYNKNKSLTNNIAQKTPKNSF